MFMLPITAFSFHFGDLLLVNSDFTVGVVVLLLHLVELLFPHMNLFIEVLALTGQGGYLSFHLSIHGLPLKEGLVLFLKSMVLFLEFVEVVLGFLELVLSHGILISVHVLELLVLLALSPESLDLNGEVFVGLLHVEMF